MAVWPNKEHLIRNTDRCVHRGRYSTNICGPTVLLIDQKHLIAPNPIQGSMVRGGMPDFEHRPDASTGGATAPNLWPLFVLLTDQKQKHLLAPNSIHGCMIGKRKPILNMDSLHPQGAPQHLTCDLLCSLNRSKTKAPTGTKHRCMVGNYKHIGLGILP